MGTDQCRRVVGRALLLELRAADRRFHVVAVAAL